LSIRCFPDLSKKSHPTTALSGALEWVAARESLLPARKLRALRQENLPAEAERLQILVERRDFGLAAQFINYTPGCYRRIGEARGHL